MISTKITSLPAHPWCLRVSSLGLELHGEACLGRVGQEGEVEEALVMSTCRVDLGLEFQFLFLEE